MAENNLKSKLKRQKMFVEQHQAGISSRVTPNSSHSTVFPSGDTAAEPGRSVVPAAAWWNREQLSDVESLWALTLTSTLSYLENQNCHLVPHLPYPSTERAITLKPDDQQWGDLDEEVAPFPELSPPSSSPDPVRLSSSKQALSAQTELARDPPDGQLCSYSRQSHNGTAKFVQDVNKRPQPSLHIQIGASSPSLSVAASGSRVSLQEKCKKKDEVLGDEEYEAVQRSVRGDGEAAGSGGLQSCPMCLLVFPAGFTQMDCDGHLAQCLSEVNVDMTW